MRYNLLAHPDHLKEAEGLIWGGVSGLVTGVAAGADVAGYVNLDDRPFACTGVRLRWATTTAFASAQAMAFRVNKVYGFTAIHTTGGTAIQAHHKFQSGLPATAVGDRVALTSLSGYIAATGAISGATYTAEDTDEPEIFAVGAGSTLPGVYEDWAPPDGLPLVLPKNTGFVVNNQIAMGGSGVGNLAVILEGFRLG
jgi:hypothetical protein